jgi:hypothetical protein
MTWLPPSDVDILFARPSSVPGLESWGVNSSTRLPRKQDAIPKAVDRQARDGIEEQKKVVKSDDAGRAAANEHHTVTRLRPGCPRMIVQYKGFHWESPHD